MNTKLLIHPNNREIAATLIISANKKSITIQDQRILNILNNIGIAVPQDFTTENKSYIYPNDPDSDLFARAFTERYFHHGLKQQGYRWINGTESTRFQNSGNGFKNLPTT